MSAPFAALDRRTAAVARRRAEARTEALAARLRSEVPADVEVENVEGGVALVGRGALRRLVLDRAPGWIGGAG